MVPQTKHAPPSRPFPGATRGTGTGGTDRSGKEIAEGAPTVGPAPAFAHGRHSGVGTMSVIPYVTVLICVVAGVYVSWHEGSHGGGLGGVIAGGAFVVAAIVRMTLPAKLAGPLTSRNRATDVVTLVAFGTCLLVLGLLLPRLRASYPHKGEWPARR
jgi:hypothetical protein